AWFSTATATTSFVLPFGSLSGSFRSYVGNAAWLQDHWGLWWRQQAVNPPVSVETGRL
ncbi:unnamed protein product, partial [Aphanomyces euteiches]